MTSSGLTSLRLRNLFTDVSLSPNSIIWHWPKDGDVVCVCVAGKVTVGLADSNAFRRIYDQVTCGLPACRDSNARSRTWSAGVLYHYPFVIKR